MSLKLRLREVPKISSVVDLEELHKVFPLSPSTVIWDWFNGCSLRRVLKKAGLPGVELPVFVMGAPVLRGKIVDEIFNTVLKLRMVGEEHPTDEEITALAWKFFEQHKNEYDLSDVGDKDGWVERLISTTNVLIEEMGYFVPTAVQKNVYLYIGEEMDVPPAINGVIPRGYPDHDWVRGAVDWIRKVPDGYAIEDLKVTTRPSKSSIGKYKLQLFTYCSAEWQMGHDIRRAGLAQINPRGNKLTIVSEEFTSSDYERTIKTFRTVRDHFLAVINGHADLKIPFRGSGTCSQWSCELFNYCPLGGGEIR